MLRSHCRVVSALLTLSNVCLEVAGRVRTLKCFLSLNSTYGACITSIELASVEFTVVFGDAWRSCCDSTSSASLDVQVRLATGHRVAQHADLTLAVAVEVNIDLCN